MNDNVGHLRTEDETEQRLRAALLTRADAVTEESLGLPPELPRPDRQPRWPVLAAAAVTVVAVGTVASLLVTGQDQRPAPAHPPRPPAGCPTHSKPCVLQSVEIAGGPLEVVGENHPQIPGMSTRWVLRVKGGETLARGSTPGDPGFAKGLDGGVGAFVPATPLRCEDVGGIPHCLLSTQDMDGAAEVLGMSIYAHAASGFTFHGRYPTRKPVQSFDLRTIDGEDVAVAVEYDEGPAGKTWWVRAWSLVGEPTGCTRSVPREQNLPGWPEVTPERAQLDPANCP